MINTQPSSPKDTKVKLDYLKPEKEEIETLVIRKREAFVHYCQLLGLPQSKPSDLKMGEKFIGLTPLLIIKMAEALDLNRKHKNETHLYWIA